MFKVILLICASSIPRGDCQVETARDVLRGPDAVDLIACGFQSQAYFAGTELGRQIRDGEYVKILCTSTVIAKRNVG